MTVSGEAAREAEVIYDVLRYGARATGHKLRLRAENALASLASRLEAAERERDDYRFWNERVRTCEQHTQDVAAPVGDCLVCNVEAERARAEQAEKALREEFFRILPDLDYEQEGLLGGVAWAWETHPWRKMLGITEEECLAALSSASGTAPAEEER